MLDQLPKGSSLIERLEAFSTDGMLHTMELPEEELTELKGVMVEH